MRLLNYCYINVFINVFSNALWLLSGPSGHRRFSFSRFSWFRIPECPLVIIKSLKWLLTDNATRPWVASPRSLTDTLLLHRPGGFCHAMEASRTRVLNKKKSEVSKCVEYCVDKSLYLIKYRGRYLIPFRSLFHKALRPTDQRLEFWSCSGRLKNRRGSPIDKILHQLPKTLFPKSRNCIKKNNKKEPLHVTSYT